MSISETETPTLDQTERGSAVQYRQIGADAGPAGAKLKPARAKPLPQPVRREAAIAEHPVSRKRGFAVPWLLGLAKGLATLIIALVAVLVAIAIWDDYVTAPWTRDGRVRVQVASVTPQVSGQITELRIRDNQFVHKGDVLYVIDPFDFETAVRSDEAQLRQKAADLQVKAVQSDRRQQLSSLATTPEEQQTYAGTAVQAKANFDAAQQQLSQAEINLQRTQVLSPVNGYVTNFQLRVGDYAQTGSANVLVIDADSYWIDGNFEETKLARICVGDRVEANLLGYSQPILGHVSTITRGIGVSDAAAGVQGLPNVDPVYTWVRLAQRVPVRIAIDSVPAGVPLVSGETATVTVKNAGSADAGPWLERQLSQVEARLSDIFKGPPPRPDCIPAMTPERGETISLPVPKEESAFAPDQLVPGLAPSITASPRNYRSLIGQSLAPVLGPATVPPASDRTHPASGELPSSVIERGIRRLQSSD
jgi:multidrug resistance efflux pump